MKFKSNIHNVDTFLRKKDRVRSIYQRVDNIFKSSGEISMDAIDPKRGAFCHYPKSYGHTTIVCVILPQLTKDTIFDEYRIASAAQDTINLEVNLDHLQRALRSAVNSSNVSMRLTKRDKFPLLTFAIHRFNGSVITQDLHIRVLSADFVSTIKEPRCPEPDVHIVLPELNTLRYVSDRFKVLADKLIFVANMNGEMTLKAETDAVKVQSSWKNLVNPELNPDQLYENQQPATQLRDRTDFARIKVDSRDWANMLKVYTVAKRAIACSYEGVNSY